jgi:hypothetical protein
MKHECEVGITVSLSSMLMRVIEVTHVCSSNLCRIVKNVSLPFSTAFMSMSVSGVGTQGNSCTATVF